MYECMFEKKKRSNNDFINWDFKIWKLSSQMCDEICSDYEENYIIYGIIVYASELIIEHILVVKKIKYL